jgi:ankyrin repeat protein
MDPLSQQQHVHEMPSTGQEPIKKDEQNPEVETSKQEIEQQAAALKKDLLIMMTKNPKAAIEKKGDQYIFKGGFWSFLQNFLPRLFQFLTSTESSEQRFGRWFAINDINTALAQPNPPPSLGEEDQELISEYNEMADKINAAHIESFCSRTDKQTEKNLKTILSNELAFLTQTPTHISSSVRAVRFYMNEQGEVLDQSVVKNMSESDKESLHEYILKDMEKGKGAVPTRGLSTSKDLKLIDPPLIGRRWVTISGQEPRNDEEKKALKKLNEQISKHFSSFDDILESLFTQCTPKIVQSSQLELQEEVPEEVKPQKKKVLQYGKTELMDACAKGDRKQIEELLESGADITAKDDNGKTALHYACEQGQSDAIQLLIEKGADINQKTEFGGFTPFMMACIAGDEKSIDVLLNQPNLKIDEREDHDRTAFMLLCALQSVSRHIVQKLIDKGADIHIQDNIGMNALITAVRAKNTEVVSLLLDNKAIVNMKENVFGRTPLMWACEDNSIEMVKLLLSKGAKAYMFDNKINSTRVFCHDDNITKLIDDQLKKEGVLNS